MMKPTLGNAGKHRAGTLALLFALMLFGNVVRAEDMIVVRGDMVEVRDEVYVKGPKVLLGDVAEIRGENAEALASVELSTAALPGMSKRLDAALVLARINNAGIDAEGVAVTGARSVVANTLHLELTREMMAEDLRRYIEFEMPWNPQDTTVDVAPPAQDVVVPDAMWRWCGVRTRSIDGRGRVRFAGKCAWTGT
ncbi:MAG: hypothetical protein GY851_01185 [bacterium]|nr:hypothetical protein [bacterium]